MKRKLIIGVLAGVVLAAAAGLLRLQSGPPGLHSRARKEWKEAAIAEMTRLSGDRDWLAATTNSLRAKAAQDETDPDAWLSDHLILMKSGEWMVYANKCRKEDRRIRDIFLGRGSDGKWYYSTFHFCIAMASLRIDEQPVGLPQFVENYFLREFDGHSDECLNLTWPPKKK